MPAPVDRLGAALAGRYQIERQLGAGGMATVFLARDLKHDRPVALKVLRPELAAVLGSERFLNEVRITAHLEHPHIVTLIDSGESDGFLWYVLPYIRGESLRERLRRDHQLGIEEALAITQQVAGALDYAHRQGVIHRDIKPENILLHEGEAMLADFGIALALKVAGADRMTQTGVSLGTPQYMSPEQATGDRLVDARSDLYSLGAVLYEMLTGEPPVTGATMQAVIAKLLTERPRGVRVVRDTVPPAIDQAVLRALAKTPADRYPSVAAFAQDLRTAVTVASHAPATARRRVTARTAVVAIALAIALFLGLRVSRGPAVRLAIGRSEQVTADPGLEIQPVLSPDGRLVAYAAKTGPGVRIYVRPASGSGSRPIRLSDDSTALQSQPRWSPDGTQLIYLTPSGVELVPALGGRARVIVAATGATVSAATWSPDGQEIAFVRGDSLFVTPTAGGTARLVGWAHSLHSCAWSPNGRFIVCVTLNDEFGRPGTVFGNLAPSGILLFPAAGGDPVQLVPPRWFHQSPVWTPDGAQLLFLSNRDGPRDIYAQAITSGGRARGEPVRLTTGLNAISISLAAGRLAYAVYSSRSNIWSLPVPRSGTIGTARATQLTFGNQVIEMVRVSRDGRWLLYDSNLRGNSDIWRIPIAGGEPEQLTSDSADEFAPDLSPDGRTLAYHSWKSATRDIEIKPIDPGPVTALTNTPRQESYPRWSPDGRSITYFDQIAPFTLYRVDWKSDGSWTEPRRLASRTTGSSWSPDGRSIAYVDAESDAFPGPVAIVPAEGGTPRILFTPGPGAPAGDDVEWAVDGVLYYKAHDAAGRASFWAVNSAGGRPRLLVRFENPAFQSYRRDFGTDGKRFYFPVDDRQSDVYVAELIGKN
jgi:serine/threonine-protein kinase